jgi:hypothetical protein
MDVNQHLTNDATGRGLHCGRFRWGGGNVEAMGNFVGITNSGNIGASQTNEKNVI